MFHQIPLSNYVNFRARMSLLIQTAGYQLMPRTNPFCFGVNFGWANEIVVSAISDPSHQNKKEFVVFSCHPGNSKEQGYKLFNHSNAWTKKTELFVSSVPYSLDISYHVKFCTVQGKYDCSLDFDEKKLRGDLYTIENFNNLSGRCKREEWPNLEKAFDHYFSKDFNWRGEIDWVDKFLNSTTKNQFDVAFGYSACIYVPYTQFQHLDTQNPSAVPAFLKEIVAAFNTLIP